MTKYIENAEKNLLDRERKLDKKVDILNTKERSIVLKERDIAAKEKALRVKTEQLNNLIEEQNEKLQRISGMTAEEAKGLLLSNLEKDVRVQASKIAKDIRDKAIREAEKEATRPDFNKSIFIDFAGANITSDAEFLLMWEVFAIFRLMFEPPPAREIGNHRRTTP